METIDRLHASAALPSRKTPVAIVVALAGSRAGLDAVSRAQKHAIYFIWRHKYLLVIK
jgi:hypothetical protein